MAEKGIVVADATSGESIATRDAFELDDQGNSRVIQRFDLSSGRGPTPIGNANRGNSTMLTTSDANDLTALPSDLTGNLIDTGDKSVLVVFAEHTGDSGYCDITPLVFDGESTPGVVTSLLKQRSVASGLRRGSSSGNYISNVLTWDVSGAHKIGIHVTSISSSNNVKIWGYVI